MGVERSVDFSGLEKFLLQNPDVLYNPDFANILTAFRGFGARIPELGESSKSGEELEDEDPFELMKLDASKDAMSTDGIVVLDDSDVAEPENNPLPIDAKAVSVFKEGEVITIHSRDELGDILDAASKASRLAVLYFTATWCDPCRYVSPVFRNLAAKYPRCVFLKADMDEARDAAFEWRVNSIPTFFILKKGIEVDQFVGTDTNELKHKIAQHASYISFSMH